MPADIPQHQLQFFFLVFVPADLSLLNSKSYLHFFIYNRLQFRADEQESPAQQKAFSVGSKFSATTSDN